ncbi:MAG: hypothetical protein GVY32_01590 [Gammaproteobacteria bacterium]|jgi:hypothetical protein|nr:hypothetical protein [Gammaproteobacteria bacterium]
MSKIDDLISQTLNEDMTPADTPQLPEPGYFAQAKALFTGRLGWVMWLVGIVQLLFSLGAIFAFFQIFGDNNVLDTLRWGIVTIVLVQLVTFLRGFMGSHFEANRVLRQLARLELRLVRSESETER